MNSVLKNDFNRLMLDRDKVQEQIAALEPGNGHRAGGPRHSDLTPLASRMVHLDFDLRTMLLDCAILGRHYWKSHNMPLINSLHSSLAIMHNLLHNLSRIQPTLKQASVEPATLRRLSRDWVRFKKSVSDMQISLQHFNMRRKMT
ncbi:MAG: hypothetical protein JRL30_23555 [Deltaproteobacteria bacterium]|nr:hypothetical protein [Deltaproteobacteria bacterium]